MNIGNVSNINYNAAALYMNSPVMRPSSAGFNPGLSPGLSPGTLSGFTPGVPPVLQPMQGNAAAFFSIDGDRAEISYGLLEALKPEGACITCQNRKYVDQSDDASVSFQTPTSLSPGMAAAAVSAHEQEHVRNEQARAHREDRQIVSQSVTLTYDTCPECGKSYVSGGTTRTTSVGKSDNDDSFEPALIEPKPNENNPSGGEQSDDSE